MHPFFRYTKLLNSNIYVRRVTVCHWGDTQKIKRFQEVSFCPLEVVNVLVHFAQGDQISSSWLKSVDKGFSNVLSNSNSFRQDLPSCRSPAFSGGQLPSFHRWCVWEAHERQGSSPVSLGLCSQRPGSFFPSCVTYKVPLWLKMSVPHLVNLEYWWALFQMSPFEQTQLFLISGQRWAIRWPRRSRHSWKSEFYEPVSWSCPLIPTPGDVPAALTYTNTILILI